MRRKRECPSSTPQPFAHGHSPFPLWRGARVTPLLSWREARRPLALPATSTDPGRPSICRASARFARARHWHSQPPSRRYASRSSGRDYTARLPEYGWTRRCLRNRSSYPLLYSWPSRRTSSFGSRTSMYASWNGRRCGSYGSPSASSRFTGRGPQFCYWTGGPRSCATLSRPNAPRFCCL